MSLKRTCQIILLALSLITFGCADDESAEENGAGSNGPLTLICSDTASVHNVDNDGDKFTECQGDCDDTDASFYPNAPDKDGDRIDNGCDNYKPTRN